MRAIDRSLAIAPLGQLLSPRVASADVSLPGKNIGQLHDRSVAALAGGKTMKEIHHFAVAAFAAGKRMPLGAARVSFA